MKWAFLILCLTLILPTAAWLRRRPELFRVVWIVFGFLPFGFAAVPQLDIAIIDWSGWPGHTKGILFSALDAAAIVIFLTLPKSNRPVPFLMPILLYLGAVMLSAVGANTPQASLFYAWQLLRIFFVYFVVARATTERAVIPPLLAGLAIGVFFQAGLAIYQRYGLGLLQTGGSFGHQNSLGLVCNLVALPFFALLLSGRTNIISVIVPLSNCFIAVLTTSRATLGLAVVGMGMIYLISIARDFTGRKRAVGLGGLFLVAALAPTAIASFEQRFGNTPAYSSGNSYDERQVFKDAASAMLSDHPFGVGANNFVLVANTGGYFERAEVIPTRSSRGAHVHNIYWLTAAETGYIGIALFLYFCFRPLKAALTCGWRHRKDRRGDLLLGLGVSLLVFYIHLNYEWVFVLSQVQYVYAIVLGMVGGLTQQLGYWDKPAGAEVAWDDVSGREPDAASPDGEPEDNINPEIRRRDDEFWGISGPGGEDGDTEARRY